MTIYLLRSFLATQSETFLRWEAVHGLPGLMPASRAQENVSRDLMEMVLFAIVYLLDLPMEATK
jgi:hypothetical protein